MIKSILPALLGLAMLGCQRSSTAPGGQDCIDQSKVNPQGMCTMQYDPVCGCDGKTYSNACVAGNAGVRRYTAGPCPGTGN